MTAQANSPSNYAQSKEVYPGILLSADVISFGSIGASFSSFTSGFIKNVDILTFTNSTNEDIEISVDGTTVFEVILSRSYREINFKTNLKFLKGRVEFYGRYVGVAPTSGSMYISAIGVP